MTNFLIGLLVGGAFVLIIIKSEASLRHREEIKQLKLENKNLRTEREDLKSKVSENAFQINELSKIVKFHQDRIEHCLEWLSGISTIKNEVDLGAHIVMTRRFREKYGLFLDDENDTYISK